MSFFKIIFSIFLFTSCTLGVETTPLKGNTPLSGGNCKVWIVTHLFKKNIDFVQPELFERDLIFFFESGKCKIIKWKDFSRGKGDTFNYSLKRSLESNPILKLERGGKVWVFELTKFTNHEIVFIPIKDTDFQYKMSITPLPEW